MGNPFPVLKRAWHPALWPPHAVNVLQALSVPPTKQTRVGPALEEDNSSTFAYI